MGEVIDFPKFGKIPRLNKQMIITEKIDGTNALVYVDEDRTVLAGSRNRWITPDADNYGFATWVYEHADELHRLGPGHHYGEWYGAGIQRKYGLSEKRFALFNVDRWTDERPECCHVVPVLARVEHSLMLTDAIEDTTWKLCRYGSQAVPGFMNPEGIVVYHTAAKQLFKVTLENDSIPKGLAA